MSKWETAYVRQKITFVKITKKNIDELRERVAGQVIKDKKGTPIGLRLFRDLSCYEYKDVKRIKAQQKKEGLTMVATMGDYLYYTGYNNGFANSYSFLDEGDYEDLKGYKVKKGEHFPL